MGRLLCVCLVLSFLSVVASESANEPNRDALFLQGHRQRRAHGHYHPHIHSSFVVDSAPGRPLTRIEWIGIGVGCGIFFLIVILLIATGVACAKWCHPQGEVVR
ncbi:hypothetical protein QR680_006139 [Steinernema hermaphroditum]|uniref:Uncharacterized protein n=1 Tax=Steinernema hermaphroditum TaxID=289476 RepID=A0AA39LW17_9BILA|nr:hypothetical protein QR680_006139 [Steinernema hermaphroditum]